MIDSGFTASDALRIVANVRDGGQRLTTVLISNADPDYHFGAEMLRRHFPDADERTTWLRHIDEMEALAPDIVVPGYMRAGSALDAIAIGYTRSYLQRFAVEEAAVSSGAALISTMQAAYPDAGLPMALDIGANVAKDEMSW